MTGTDKSRHKITPVTGPTQRGVQALNQQDNKAQYRDTGSALNNGPHSHENKERGYQ
jgi:hypothetical protein